MREATRALARLQTRIDYRFVDPQLLQRAMTHRSAGAVNYERLEFLGDGLLNFIVGAALFERCLHADEGALSRLRASLVCEATLAAIATELSLGDCLILGESELKSGGHRRASILADALEALCGAVFLDSGFAAAQALVLRLYARQLDNLPDPERLKDAKTRLQEWLQARARPLPEYAVLEEAGPPHARRFQVRCTLADASAPSAEANGESRRIAEQRAAERVLELLQAEAGAA